MKGQVDDAAIIDMLNKGAKQHLGKLGGDMVGYVVPNTGIDTGDLRTSIGYRVRQTRTGPVLTVGSGVSAPLGPIVYGPAHWAGDQSLMAGIPVEDQGGIRRRRRRFRSGRSTFPGRKPWLKFLKRAKGLVFRRTPGAPEV